MGKLFSQVIQNAEGRDFVVGDLHGSYDVLMRKMEKVNFDPAKDRVFSVGDLVNRGASSFRCLNLVKNPWFFAVKGNHEQVLLENFESFSAGDEATRAYLRKVGGEWLIEGPELYEEAVALIDGLPIAIQVGGTDSSESFGIVHACTPREDDTGQSRSWTWLSSVLQIPEMAEAPAVAMAAPILNKVAEQMLWDRSLIKAYLKNTKSRQLTRLATIGGIGRVFHGHSVLPNPMQVGNRFYIDTGAGHAGGRLTFIEARDYS